jgi:hypothetical protein
MYRKNQTAPAVLPLAVILLGAIPVQILGTSFLEFDPLDLQPDQAGQAFTLYLRNDGPAPITIGGLDLALQIGDGSPDAGSIPEKPRVTSVELIAGTLFQGFSPIIFADGGNQPYRQYWSVTIPSLGAFPEVPFGARLPIATVEFDATALTSGTFDLGLLGTAAGDTIIYDSFGLPLLENHVSNGVLTIAVPTAVSESGSNLIWIASITWTLIIAAYRRSAAPLG